MLESTRRRKHRPRHAEEDEPAEDEPQLAVDQRSVPSHKLWTALAVVVAGCGLSGSKSPWALGILAVLIALNLVIAPPRSPVARAITWPLLLFALLSLGSFLPLREAAVPGWRKIFVQDFGVSLGSLRSPQPWLSFETWIVVGIGLIWVWHCLGRGFNEPERRWLMRMLTLMVSVIAALAVWVKQADITVPFWQRSEWAIIYFGPFPNRNHFGSLLAMGAVLAFAIVYDAYRRRNPWWLAWSLCLLPIVWALVSNTSRAGIGLFFLGLLAWTAFASFSRRSARRMGVVAAILLVLMTVVIIFGQNILERMNLGGGKDPISSNLRFRVWMDSVTMISKAPLLGVGLACFGAVFPFHQTYINTHARHIHPESDWIWLAAEAGIPAMLMLAVALINYILQTGLWKSNPGQKGRKDQRLRNACAVAAIILPVHGLIDTPAHQPGLICFAALLAGLSCRARRPSGDTSEPQSSRTRLVFAGFCCLAGITWFTIAAGFPVLPGNSSARLLENKANDLIQTGNLAAAKTAINRQIAMNLLDWGAYYDRAELSLARGLPPNAALEDFARVRYLEPNIGFICQKEASVWLQYYPAYAPAAWREAMRRDSEFASLFYANNLATLREHPELRSALRSLATTPRLKLDYLISCNGEDFAVALAELLEIQPTLEGFSSFERYRLFHFWYTIGDRKQLIARLEQEASWRADGWPLLAQDLTARGDFRGAYKLAFEYLPPPARGGSAGKGDLAQLRRDFLFHPTDFNYGFVLAEAESSKGLISDALVTLDKVSQLPNAPDRVLYEQAVLLSRKGDHAAAWNKMRSYIDKWQVTQR